MKYGWDHYFSPTPKNVAKWLLGIRATIALVQAAAIYEHMDWKWQMGLLVIGGICHEAGMLFADDKSEEKVG